MGLVKVRYRSMALNGHVSFNAVIPFENFGTFPNLNKEPFTGCAPLKTLYLLHGITDDENSWLVNTGIAEYAERYHIAVIMPYGYNNFYVDSAATELWGEFIGKELVAYTRGMFRLSDKREDTFIGGLSMGGYGALVNGLKYNETFGKIIALSAGLRNYQLDEFTDDAAILLRRKDYVERVFGPIEEIPGSDKDPEQLFLDAKIPTPVFMAVGDDDALKGANRRYRDFLQEHGADLTYYEAPGSHEWSFWDRNIRTGIEWLLGTDTEKKGE